MKDLTKGNPFKLILLFALPVFLGCVFQQLYNMVDTVIVGNTVNASALTGVGLTGPINFLILGFVNGLTSGFSVRIAQRFGADDMDGVRRAVAMSFMLCVVITVVLTAVAVPLAAPLLRFMEVGEDYFPYAYNYLFVIFLGIGATVFYNMTAGILRAVGDSRNPLWFLIAAAVLNVGLDFVFIMGLKMHYHGAALATVISQLLSGVACFIFICIRHPELRLTRADWKWSWRLAGGHIAVGLPMALQFSITAVGCMIQQKALNGLAESSLGAATAYVAATKIDNLAAQSFVALGTALATYSGQNCGAGRMDRVRTGVKVGMVYVACGSVIGVAFCMGLYYPLMDLFLNAEIDPNVALYYDDILAYGFKYLLIQSADYLFLGTIYIYRNALQGIGKSTLAMMGGVVELGSRVLTAFVFVKIWGFTGVCFSNPIAWVACDVFLMIAYYIVMHAIKKKEKPQQEEQTPLSAAA
ncbi:MAG: MATE family efflux transporter [Clostridia bacterium]|nr:MATE family efflux transporter [Clostridia bacterium]